MLEKTSRLKEHFWSLVAGPVAHQLVVWRVWFVQ
jgi:hypothetical protein